MQIILAKTAGFCFGVDRAVEMVAESVRSGNKTATLGPIIHNRHVVDKFLKLGVREIAAPEEAEPGETVIIRAHGVPKRVQEKLSRGGANVLDATCPFVKKIHTIVKNETEKGRKILIFGSSWTAAKCQNPRATSSIRTCLPRCSAWMRCAFSCCARSRSDRTATSPMSF